MSWANMINHIIFSLALPIPESGEDEALKELAPEGTLRGTIQPKLCSFIAREPITR
jgi:hypothetical protein